MIAYLKGKILNIQEKSLILLVNNIGYEIFSNLNSLSDLEKNSETEFYIYNHIREDINALYGFKSREELEFFRILIGINGIGPKAGLEILNNPIDKIKEAINSEDIAFITKTPGIGAKTAKRIILELKGKLPEASAERKHKSLINDDIIDALKNLGFNKNEVMKTLEKLPKNVKKEEEIISFFLKHN
ncbi:Holliday junction branch migration protein RuvA [Candidatus Peregrinibacteria bacterium]|nr:Holliday junction branch migration protein RuvA [Candidatus Peregrinibacteria bacterium]